MASVEKYALLNRREIKKKRGNDRINQNYTDAYGNVQLEQLLAMFVQSGSKPKQKG